TRARLANPDPDADELRGPEALDHAPEAVVAGVAPANLHPDVLPGEIELVVEDENVRRRDLQERRRGLNAVARQVHERHRLQERDRMTEELSFRPDAGELLLEVRERSATPE